jgi:hypothetical protein
MAFDRLCQLKMISRPLLSQSQTEQPSNFLEERCPQEVVTALIYRCGATNFHSWFFQTGQLHITKSPTKTYDAYIPLNVFMRTDKQVWKRTQIVTTQGRSQEFDLWLLWMTPVTFYLRGISDPWLPHHVFYALASSSQSGFSLRWKKRVSRNEN